MPQKYSYNWYIQRFKHAKENAEQFILSVDEAYFNYAPAQDKWSIAECYSHLLNSGNLYLNNWTTESNLSVDTPEQSFRPRWVIRKIISIFEPPYRIKLKTINPMKPDQVSEQNRMELLDEYVNLQDRIIAKIEKAKHRHTDLLASKVPHPVIPIFRISLSECLAITEVHQRRHQWQAEQTLKALLEKAEQ